MRIALCQVDSQWEKRSATRDRISRLLGEGVGRTDCIVFPEMALSGFSMDRVSTSLDPSDLEFFDDLAARTGASVLYGGVEGGANCIFMARPGEASKVVYRKRHLFAFGGERDHYVAGGERTVVEIGGMRLALAICYDLRFTYHFWASARDCEGYLVIASWPECRREHWMTLLRARAIENQAFVAGVNRVGTDPKLSFSGDSSVYGPFGERLLECGPSEGVYCCEMDPARTAEVRERYRFLEDRLE